jgi:hypothetical protein
VKGALALATLAALGGCRPSAPSATQATTVTGAVSDLARCAFDAPEPLLGPRAQVMLEGALRRELRADRYAFSVRAGRCASAVSESLRREDPRARALADAWEGLLPLAQAQSPDDIALEQWIRRVGRAWRDALRR